MSKPLTLWQGCARAVPRLLALAVGAAAATAHAEDIDLYAIGNGAAVAPNVLFLLDNSSNWSNNSQAWTKTGVTAKCNQLTITDTVTGTSDASATTKARQECQGAVEAIFGTSTSLKQGEVEVRALRFVIQELVCGANGPKLNVNIGLMLLSADKGAITGNDNSWVGGWIAKAIEDPKLGCARLIDTLDKIDANINEPGYKASQDAHYGGAMMEAFKYFGGYANPAQARLDQAGSPVGPEGFGPQRYTKPYDIEDPAAFTDDKRTTYRSPIGLDGVCGRNYLVLVGNTFPKLEPETKTTPVNDVWLDRLGYPGTQIYETNPASKRRYADEWAAFLSDADVSPEAGTQSVTTYAVNVYNEQPDADQTLLLKSMARVGGGGAAAYFEVGGDLYALIRAFKDIFTQVAAINSVFASASLPVSVNTQGTFLNQVFIGMFRPDGDGRPRWNGNLKQYQFAIRDGELFLADRTGAPAVNNANTGFLRSCARSFWTSDSGNYWQSVPNTPEGTCLDGLSNIFSDLPDGEVVEKGGAGQGLRSLGSADARQLYTCSGEACKATAAFTADNVKSIDSTYVNWARGRNVGDGPATESGFYETYNRGEAAVRPTVHGAVIHSRPLAINYGRLKTDTQDATDDVVVFYGANDGVFRAIDGNQTGTQAGREMWGFIAPEHFQRFGRLRENSPLVSFPGIKEVFPDAKPMDYFFDGAIGAYQERSADGAVSRVYLYPAMRRGGRLIYGFDASRRPRADNSASAPSVMWRFGCATDDDASCSTASAARLGQTWSTPRAVRLKDADGNAQLYVAFGAGYDVCEDTDSCGAATRGQGIFVVDAETGVLSAFIDLRAKHAGAGRVMGDLVTLDANGDGFTDLIYAGDTRGNLWRINTSDAAKGFASFAPSAWAENTWRIASVADWSGAAWDEKRKIQYAPDVVLLGTTALVFFGTGDREQPLQGSNATRVKNRFYSVRDLYTTQPASVIRGTDCDAAGDVILNAGCDLLNVSALDDGNGGSLDYASALENSDVRGWVLELATASEPFEQVVTTPVTAGGVVFFSTFQARSTTENICSNLGTARGYAVNFLTGGLRRGDDTREAEFVGGGIPPSPVAGVVQIGDTKVPFIVGGKPSSGATSAIEGGRVPVNVLPRRTKIYRYQRIDAK